LVLKGGRGFEVRWRTGGKFRQRTITVRRDVDRFALEVESEVADGNATERLVKNGRTVRQVVEAYRAASKPEMKPRSYYGYVINYDKRVLQQFGSPKIGTVTRADVHAWVAKRHGAGLAPAAVHRSYVALQKVMRYALDDRLVSYNPCDCVRLPGNHDAGGFQPVFLSAQQVKTLAGQLDLQSPYGLLVRIAATPTRASGT